MSRIMCMEDCPYHTKTGYCQYSYCDEKPFYLYKKDEGYHLIKSNKDVLDKKKLWECLDVQSKHPDTSMAVVFKLNLIKNMITGGWFDVEITEKEMRK